MSWALFVVAIATLPFAEPAASDGKRIIGGSDAPEGQYPYQISIRDLKSHLCGGSIISQNWVLTAAHCMHSQDISALTVVSGTNYLNSGGRRYSLSQIIPHPAYDPSNNVNDIALLRVKETIAYDSKIQAISLAAATTPPGTWCILSGWGLTAAIQLPNSLQHIYLRTISINECIDTMAGLPVAHTNVCTFTKAGEGACQGDSGGPLAANGEQIGVLSWGIPCAMGKPDVFTSVPAYLQWIRSQTGI